MRWFRFYHDWPFDPRIRGLRPELFRAWVEILCLASKQEPRGTLPPVPEIALALRMRKDHVERYIGDLVALDLLQRSDSGAIEDPHWSSLQADSDTSTKRVKRHRERTSGDYKTSRETVSRNGHSRAPASEIRDRERGEERESPLPLHVSTPAEKPDREPFDPGDDGDEIATVPEPPKRNPIDQADLDKAIALLKADHRTFDVAAHLSRYHALPINMRIEGWQWLLAAEVMTGPGLDDSKRGSFPYLIGVAKTKTPRDRVPAIRSMANRGPLPRGAQPFPEPAQDFHTASAEDRERLNRLYESSRRINQKKNEEFQRQRAEALRSHDRLGAPSGDAE